MVFGFGSVTSGLLRKCLVFARFRVSGLGCLGCFGYEISCLSRIGSNTPNSNTTTYISRRYLAIENRPQTLNPKL